MGNKILVVDDDETITKLIKRYLESHSYVVATANDGIEALNLAKDIKPDLVLSDAQMPGLDGHALCRTLRREIGTRRIPLILMSGAWIQESNILAGFEGGADDYVLKPLSMPILAARIEAVLKRAENSKTEKITLEKCGVELDHEGRTVKVNGERIELTRKEFDLLSAMVNKPNRVLSVAYLLENVWGYDPADYNDPSTVEAHISRLRKKLGPDLARRIVNVTGYGYKFETEE